MARNRTKKTTQNEDNSPADISLQTPENQGLKEAASKESIEAAINDKLARKNDDEGPNPFIPLSQLNGEVQEVADKEGFELNRGTEVGARLLARSRRIFGE